MPIHYDAEKKAWSLEHITQEELDLLVNMGQHRLLEMLGAGLLLRLQREAKESFLEQIEPEQMGQA